jgi:predicted GIY-YIG superfamily endonuclease
MGKLCYVYVLENRSKDFVYVGLTFDICKRVYEHSSGLVQSTKAYIPLDLKIYIAVPTRVNARQLEKYLKVGSGKTILKKRFIFEESIMRVDPGLRNEM